MFHFIDASLCEVLIQWPLRYIFLWEMCFLNKDLKNNFIRKSSKGTSIYHCLFVSGLGWTQPCDIWSVGCILVELCTVGYASASTYTLCSIASLLFLICWDHSSRVQHFFKHMRTWSIWLWWRGCWDRCQSIWLKKQGKFLLVWWFWCCRSFLFSSSFLCF